MRILLLRTRGEWAYGGLLYFYEFEQELAKKADCIHAGPGWPLYREGETVDQTVKRIYGGDSPDWVIDRERVEILNPNRDYFVGHNLTDIHGRAGSNIGNPKDLLKVINTIGYDAVFMKAPYIYNCEVPPTYYIDHLQPKMFFLPYSIDPEKYYPRFPKKWDITFIGSSASRYPFRESVKSELPQFCEKHGFTVLIKHKGPRPCLYAAKQENDPEFYVRDRYADALGRSRFFPFCGGIHGYPVQKYFEVPASGCISLATKVLGVGDALGLVDGENYVEVTKSNWKKWLLYYDKNKDEAQHVIRNGRKLMLTRHTHEVRVQEFLKMLKTFK